MFDQQFWDSYYRERNLPWDMGEVSPPLKAYIDQLTDKQKKILIPGAGNGHEAEYLWQQGFHNIYVLDISPLPLKNLRERIPDMPDEQLIRGDFFRHKGKYDLILEQTFFCALHPSLRQRYAARMRELLSPGGKLCGLLFTFPLDINQDKPPFGGSPEEYDALFSPYFSEVRISLCYNSHPARKDNEVFFQLGKPVR